MLTRPYTRIMLVAHHPSVRSSLRASLETSPHFKLVAEAGNCNEALQHAASRPIDLALIDGQLGSMNGIDLAAHFHALHPQIAILMLSAHDESTHAAQIMQVGARGYVEKNAAPADIINAVDTAMAGDVYYDPKLTKEGLRPPPSVPFLTAREREILYGIATGKSNKHIARELDLSVRTVETHRLNIKRKIVSEGKTDLIRFAQELTNGANAVTERM